MNEIAKNRKDGVYGVMDIPLYLQLIFVKQIKQYIKAKTEDGSWPLHLFFMEYYCGSWLSKTVNIPLSNLVPHAFKPCMYYQQCIDAFFSFNLTWSSIEDYDYRDIYELIIGQRNRQILIPNAHLSSNQTWKNIHYKVLLNYLKPFNNKIMRNLLSVTTKRHSDLFRRVYGCPFCKSNDELNSHLFFSCSKIQGVWDLVTVCLFKLTGCVQGCGSGSGGSGHIVVEAEARKICRFRFYIIQKSIL